MALKVWAVPFCLIITACQACNLSVCCFSLSFSFSNIFPTPLSLSPVHPLNSQGGLPKTDLITSLTVPLSAFSVLSQYLQDSLVAQLVKNPPAMQET